MDCNTNKISHYSIVDLSSNGNDTTPPLAGRLAAAFKLTQPALVLCESEADLDRNDVVGPAVIKSHITAASERNSAHTSKYTATDRLVRTDDKISYNKTYTTVKEFVQVEASNARYDAAILMEVGVLICLMCRIVLRLYVQDSGASISTH